MKKTFLTLLLAISLLSSGVVFAQDVKITADEKKAAEAITAAQMSSYLHFIASDAMGGRDTPSQGLDITAEFIKMNLQKWGFKPAGDEGTYFQRIALTRESADTEKTQLEIGGKALKYGEDFLRVSGNSTANGALVFGKDGWMVKSKGIDAFSGVDVTGKIVVITSTAMGRSLSPRPSGVSQDDLKGVLGEDWADPATYAAKKSAAGIIVIAPQQQNQIMANWAAIRNQPARGGYFPEKLRPTTQPNPLPVVVISKPVADAMFSGEAGNAASAKAFDLKRSAVMTSAMRKETVWTQNVVALWEGADPILKNEMVAIGAHYDHVGTNPNAQGDDKIWNGADDDGSGTVAVLSIAEALAQAKIKPKRSILFVWHAGEEKGLWGADYFNKFPTVDIKNVIAQLNIDMIGRSLDPAKVIKCTPGVRRCNENLTKANEIYVIGSEMMSSTLGAITKRTNSAFLNLEYNYKYDDPNDKERFFFRSDHFHYAQNGIPIAFWFDGVHEDYHQPSDTADKIDYQKMEKVARTIFLTMWELTELKERPKIDKQLPPELSTVAQ